LARSFKQIQANLVIYLAGADPFKEDRFGRLALTKTGLARRDQMLFDGCAAAGLPLAVTMAGAYCKQVEDTVDIHFQTVVLALKFQNPSTCRAPKPFDRHY